MDEYNIKSVPTISWTSQLNPSALVVALSFIKRSRDCLCGHCWLHPHIMTKRLSYLRADGNFNRVKSGNFGQRVNSDIRLQTVFA